MTVTVEPSIFLEKEIKGNASFADVRDSFKTWEDRKGTSPYMPSYCCKEGKCAPFQDICTRQLKTK